MSCMDLPEIFGGALKLCSNFGAHDLTGLALNSFRQCTLHALLSGSMHGV